MINIMINSSKIYIFKNHVGNVKSRYTYDVIALFCFGVFLAFDCQA